MKRLLSYLYGIGVYLRNLFYDENILYSYSPKLPTIAVGNLAVGGTGKTPHTEYLVGLLLREGYRVAILSRGYKRRTKGFLIADASATAAQIGDEPRQMQRKFPEAMVVVAEDRVTAIRRLTRQFPELDVIVLDDAFQHRKVRCGYNILLTPADTLYVNDHLLPYGRLREHSHGANRSDVVVVTKCPPTMLPIDRRVITTSLHCPTFQELCFSSIRYGEPLPVFDAATDTKQQTDAYATDASEIASATDTEQHTTAPSVTLSELRSILLVAGIADPHYLRDYLGDAVQSELIYPDHHAFKPKDIARITAALEALPSYAVVLTTEKDAVRLRDADSVPPHLRSRFYYLPIAVDFGDYQAAFDARVLRYMREHRRRVNP